MKTDLCATWVKFCEEINDTSITREDILLIMLTKLK